MKKTITLLLALIAFISIAKAQTAGENIDVNHYEIHLDNFNFTDHTLQGEALVTFTATANTGTVVLELKTLTANSVLCETVGVSGFSQDGDFLTIQLAQTLSAGQSATLDILYGGNTFNETWGGVHWWGDGYVYNLGVGMDSQPHNLGKTWFPCVDNFVDKATYDLFVTVDNDQKAICGGNFVNTTDNGDGTSTWHWQVPQEVSTYPVSFTVGDYVLWEDTYHGIERDIPIEVYVKPALINSVPGTFVHIHDIAAFLENSFGPYPFNRIGYVCTGQGCMEHIDNIALVPSIITGNTNYEDYLAHELSHMYFGNKASCSTAGDMWLSEGFAQFCGWYYRSELYGDENYQQTIQAKIVSITGWCKKPNNWIPLNNIPGDMTYDGDAVYDRGAVIVNTLLNYLGPDNFFLGLRHYLETYAYGAASSEQLRDALTEGTGIDMNGFFDTYVFTAGMPHYAAQLIETTPNGNLYDARIRLGYRHIGPEHVGQNNRVEVTFMGSEGQLQTEMACWDGLEAENTFSLAFEPIAVFSDYFNHFLDGKVDKNGTFTTSGSLTQGKFKALINSVSDSTMLRIEDHYLAPDNDPGILGLTISSSHYWDFFRNDIGEASVSAQIMFNQTTDGDIIHTENDSAVLLYRTDPSDNWHLIDGYSFEGTWKLGRFTVDNVPSGQYTIGAIDKVHWSVNGMPAQALHLFPVPTRGVLHVEVASEQPYRIANLTGQTLMTGTTQGTIDVSGLAAGAYLININGIVQKFIVQ